MKAICRIGRTEALSSESPPHTRCGVDTGSREENPSNKETEPFPFRFNRNGNGSDPACPVEPPPARA
jgi:hypothetical protein